MADGAITMWLMFERKMPVKHEQVPVCHNGQGTIRYGCGFCPPRPCPRLHMSCPGTRRLSALWSLAKTARFYTAGAMTGKWSLIAGGRDKSEFNFTCLLSSQSILCMCYAAPVLCVHVGPSVFGTHPLAPHHLRYRCKCSRATRDTCPRCR